MTLLPVLVVCRPSRTHFEGPKKRLYLTSPPFLFFPPFRLLVLIFHRLSVPILTLPLSPLLAKSLPNIWSPPPRTAPQANQVDPVGEESQDQAHAA